MLFGYLSLLKMQYCFILMFEAFISEHHDLLLLVVNLFAVLQKLQ